MLQTRALSLSMVLVPACTAAAQSAPSTASRPASATLQARVAQAESESGVVLSFASLHLRAEPVPRPQARQGLRLAKAWLDKFVDLAGLSPAFAGSTYASVEAIVRAAHGAAKIDEPDTAEDALFRVDYLTRLTRKRWREALAALDEYLARDPQNEKVLAMRRARLNQARAFLDDKLQSATACIANGDRGQMLFIKEQLAFQLETGGLEEWGPALRNVLERLDTALAKK